MAAAKIQRREHMLNHLEPLTVWRNSRILKKKMDAEVEKLENLNLGGISKRQDYLDWEDYFMSIAFLSAMRSKDPNTQVGACIVNNEKKIVGVGYNGMPRGCSDDDLPWDRTSDDNDILKTKYPYVCHAEMNAIMNKISAEVKDCSIYVALFPCNECAKLIIQAGITEVIYMSDKNHNKPGVIASRTLFDLAKIKYRQFKPKCNKIIIDFNSIPQVSANDISSSISKFDTGHNQ